MKGEFYIKTNIEFVDYLYEILKRNTVYMWGGYGKIVTNNLINQKKRQYPSHYPSEKVAYLKTLVGKNYYSYDCSGLIKSYWMSDFGTEEVKYIKKYDKDAYGITLGNASKKGSIKTLPEVPGTLLYMKGHCGVYIGNGKVIECTSNEKISKKKCGGVCISKLKDRPWSNWAFSKWLNYGNNDDNDNNNEIKYYIVQRGDTLSEIALKYHTTVDELVRINNIKNKNMIKVGQKIILPNEEKYIVQKGDTLSKIAKKYKTTWQDIYEKNKDIIKNPHKIYPGQILSI